MSAGSYVLAALVAAVGQLDNSTIKAWFCRGTSDVVTTTALSSHG